MSGCIGSMMTFHCADMFQRLFRSCWVTHRSRALVLLGRFLDIGPWAVDLVCSWALLHVHFYKYFLFMLWCAQSTLHHCFRPCLLEYSLMCSNCFQQVHWNCVKFLCSYGQKISRLIRHTLLEWSFSPVGPAHMACGARPVAVARFYGLMVD